MIPLTRIVEVAGALILVISAVELFCQFCRTLMKLESEGLELRGDLLYFGGGVIVVVLSSFAAHYVLGSTPESLAAAAKTFFGTMTLLTLAWLLFVLRIKSLYWYAVLEILFGIVVAVHTIRGLGDVVVPSDLLLAGSAMYLLIRGFDNFHTYIAKHRNKLHNSIGISQWFTFTAWLRAASESPRVSSNPQSPPQSQSAPSSS